VNDPNLGGVIEHQFDGQEDQGDGGRGDRRWLPCRALLCPVVPCRGAAKSWTALSWCGEVVDCPVVVRRSRGLPCRGAARTETALRARSSTRATQE